MSNREFIPEIEIKNRKASYQYFLGQHFEAGLVLRGSEIKSIRNGSASLSDAFCFLQRGELYVKNMHIAEYKFGSPHSNHDPLRQRKLLLKKNEIKRIEKEIKQKGSTIIPIRLFINEHGLAKLEIAIAKGKKYHDKRDSLKEKDMKRDIDRAKQSFDRNQY